jgi:uncharacterized protein YpuA (DUF1002 family)
MKTVLILAGVMMLGAATVDAQDKVRVFVETPTGEFVDETLKARQDSTKDLIKYVRKNDDHITQVQTAEEADLVVKVVSREEVATGDYSAGVRGSRRSEAEKANRVTVELRTRNGHVSTVSGDSVYPMHTWSSAAAMAFSKLETFVKTNKSKLLVR